MIVLEQRPDRVPLSRACDVLGLNRSTVYGRLKRSAKALDPAQRSRKQVPQLRALSDVERQARQTGERRNQRAPQSHAMPRLTATRPNEVWTWDISKLPTIKRGVYLNLYVVMDLYSRVVVSWMVSHKENGGLAKQLLQQTLTRYELDDQPITLHQDRGSPMIAQSFLDLMAHLNVTCSHSRPRVSNDNPVSESGFKTLKHPPDYPGRFLDIGHARHWMADYFRWYNHDHHHSGLNGYTPAQVYNGEQGRVVKAWQAALDCDSEATLPPQAMHINPITSGESDGVGSTAVNFPTLPAAVKALERANRY